MRSLAVEIMRRAELVAMSPDLPGLISPMWSAEWGLEGDTIEDEHGAELPDLLGIPRNIADRPVPAICRSDAAHRVIGIVSDRGAGELTESAAVREISRVLEAMEGAR